MAEHTNDHTRAVIAAAIAAAGAKGNNEGAWKARINEAIPHVVSMLNESSRQWKIAEEVLNAQIFTAIYRGYELEDSSKRCVVTIETKVSKRYPTGLEPIRTHRTDNAQGETMRARLDQLADGDTILVFKAMESINDETKVRVLVHFEKLPYRKDQADQERTPEPSQDRGNSGVATGPVEEHSAGPPAYTDEIDSERLVMWRSKTMDALTNAQFDELKARLAGGGYDFFGVSEIEWDTVVRPIIRELLAE